MAADADNNEDKVNGNGMMGEGDCYVSYYDIVKLILSMATYHLYDVE